MRTPQNDEPVFDLRVRRIKNGHGKRITEHRGGLFKKNAMFGQI